MRLQIAVAALAMVYVHAATPVWIDTDPSVAPGGHEVDDGLALLQAFHSPELRIVGISAVFGNAPLDRAFPIAKHIVDELGPKSLSVYAGAASAADLGRETDASRAIAAALEREPLTIVAIGPATNVGTVVLNHPELCKRIVRIIAVAGRRPGQQFRASPSAAPFRDFNLEMDPAAFEAILDSGVPLVLAPWEISSKVWLRKEDIAGLPRFLRVAATDWLDYWTKHLAVDGFNPFDTLAVGYAVSTRGFECEELGVKVEKTPPNLFAAKDIGSPHRTLYCHAPPPDFKDKLLRRIIIHSGE